MVTTEKRTTTLCNRLQELPLVFNEWQQQAWCPDCVHYKDGECDHPFPRGDHAACPFEGKALFLREVLADMAGDQPGNPLGVALCEDQEKQSRLPALMQAIKLQIAYRTGGRIRALAIELTDRELIVRGSAPCYYVKQLALQGVLDVLDSNLRAEIECNIQIVVRSLNTCVQ